jgi:cathepsin X
MELKPRTISASQSNFFLTAPVRNKDCRVTVDRQRVHTNTSKCQPYIACSSDSSEGFCPFVDTSCRPENICRSCLDRSADGACHAVHSFPNATISEYGTYHNASVDAIKAEIYARGPVKASVNATPLVDYRGGLIRDMTLRNQSHNHGVSIVGWGILEDRKEQYWIVRNSWGEYWGQMGFFRVLLGYNLLGIESNVSE